MNIAEVVAVFPPYPGGTGYVCYHNALELSRRGHDVTVFTLDYNKISYCGDPPEFRIVRLRTPLLHGGGGIVPQLLKHLREFDVIHLHYPFFGGAEYVYLASLLRKQNYFLTYHMDVLRDSFVKQMILPFYESFFAGKIIRKASWIGALSIEHLKSSKAARTIDWNKVTELPNGVDMEIFAPREKDVSLVSRYRLQDKTVILFVGHLIPLKGLRILIEAIAMLNRKDIALIIVGTGPSEAEFRIMVTEKGLDDIVHFAGHVSQTGELPSYYNTCDFLVLPSTSLESFGMVVLEAMASGKPSIVTSLPGPARLVENGVYGLIAKTGDPLDLKEKIEYFIENNEERLRMGALGRVKAMSSYSWKAVGDVLEGILAEIG